MKKVLAFLLGIWLLSSCSSSSDGSTESSTSQSIADSTYRPAFHFSPKKNWMGAPVSMIFHNGEYHLFYEFNSKENSAESNSWGHAVSKDMLTWNELQPIFEDKRAKGGSIVLDANNTSGFGENTLIAIMNEDDEVSLSYSLNGSEWTKYKSTLLELQGTPKVSWNADSNQWIMTLTQEDKIIFFSSNDLISWSQEGELNLDKPYSSAELFAISNTWGLLLNGNDGVDLMIGEFDRSTFIPVSKPSLFDLGFDNGAGTIMKTQDRYVFIGLMNNKTNSNSSPTKSWNSLLTLPREITLAENDQFKSFPIKEIASIVVAKRRGKLKLLKSTSSNWYSLTPISKSQKVELTISNDASEKIILKYDQSTFTLDRSKSGLNEFDSGFSEVITREYVSLSDTIKFDIFIDHSSVEIFINDGRVQFSSLVFPQNSYKSVSLIVDGELENASAILYDIETVM